MVAPVIPAYGRSTIADVLPSIGARWGVHPSWHDVIGLPDGDRWVVVLVDGLGDLLLSDAAASAPFLTSLRGRPGSGSLTSGVPSTTATSLTSLGTGLTPGEHGIAGYSFRNPFDGTVLNALTWQDGLSGLDVQPRLTALERMAGTRIAVTSVCPQRFAGSGLTEAALRGPRFAGVPDENDHARRIELAVDAATAGHRSLVYFYERHLDHAGHVNGWRSPEWLTALSRIDRMVRDLRAALPADVRVVVTADHGMVDVPASGQIVIENDLQLTRGVELVAGEGRLRQLYTRQQDARHVARRWAERLGEDAWVRTRDEAIDEGWFGPIGLGLASRFGDVLAAMRTDRALMTLTQPKEFTLVGMHGSLTPAETAIPILVA